jgi:hypothetical protein
MALQVEIQQELSGMLCPNPLKLLGKGFSKVREEITQKSLLQQQLGDELQMQNLKFSSEFSFESQKFF